MTTPSTADLRAWARENGFTVASRGRVSSDVLSAWQSAHTPTRRHGRSAPKPIATGASAAPEAGQDASAEQDLATAAVRAELAALTKRVQELETRLAVRAEKKRRKKK